MDAIHAPTAEIVELFPGAMGLVVVSADWRGSVFYEPSWYLFPDRVRVDNTFNLPGDSGQCKQEHLHHGYPPAMRPALRGNMP